jgi:hypothetical protein
MSNFSEPSNTSPSNPPPTEAELTEMITELEQYRERLVNETMEAAQRAKLMKSAVMVQLEPQLATIDTALQQLQQQRAELAARHD